MDDKGNIIDIELLTLGGISSAVADIKLTIPFLNRSKQNGATKFIIWHNHPSGNTTPSQADYKVTEFYKNATLPLPFFDHIIINGDNYFSFNKGKGTSVILTKKQDWEGLRIGRGKQINESSVVKELAKAMSSESVNDRVYFIGVDTKNRMNHVYVASSKDVQQAVNGFISSNNGISRSAFVVMGEPGYSDAVSFYRNSKKMLNNLMINVLDGAYAGSFEAFSNMGIEEDGSTELRFSKQSENPLVNSQVSKDLDDISIIDASNFSPEQIELIKDTYERNKKELPNGVNPRRFRQGRIIGKDSPTLDELLALPIVERNKQIKDLKKNISEQFVFRPIENRVAWDAEKDRVYKLYDTGVDSILKRVEAQIRFEKLSKTNRFNLASNIDNQNISDLVREFFDVIGHSYFDGTAIQFVKLSENTQGTYRFFDNIVSINKNRINQPHTYVHEFFHHLMRFVPTEFKEKFNNQYIKSKTSFIKNHPALKGLTFKFKEPTEIPISSLILNNKEFSQLADNVGTETVNKYFRKDGLNYVFMFNESDYRYDNFLEYFAEMMTDRYFDFISETDPDLSTFIGVMRLLYKNFVRTLKDFAGIDMQDTIMDKFANQEFDSNFNKYTDEESTIMANMIETNTLKEIVSPDSQNQLRFSKQSIQPNIDDKYNSIDPIRFSLASDIKDKFGSFRYEFQDNFIDLKKYQQSLEDKGITINDYANPYQGETLYHGKVGSRILKFREDKLESFAKNLRSKEIGLERLENYLYALHAKERNKRIAEITDGDNQSGSGMTDAEADAIIMQEQASSDFTNLDELQKQISEINKGSLYTRYESGIITSDEYNRLTNRYDFYVPLKHDDDGLATAKTGKGFDQNAKGIINALGRKSRAENIVANVFLQAEESIIREEKNIVMNRLLNFVQENPDENAYKVSTKLPMRKTLIDGKVKQTVDTGYPTEKNVVTVRQSGKKVFIEFSNEHARIAEAIKNLGATQTNLITTSLGKLLRMIKTNNTSYNPEFAVTNFIRDVIFGLTNLSDSGQAITKDVILSIPKALAGARHYIRNKDTSTEWSKIYEDFSANGGKVNFMGLQDVESITSNLTKELNRISKRPSLIGGFKSFIKFVEDYNTVIETGIRLATYKALLDKGESKSKAAAYAKNLTVNFDKKGNSSQHANALYMFFNAGIQGSARIMSAMKNKKVQKLALSGVLFGFVNGIIQRIIGGEDEDDRYNFDKVNNFTRHHSMVFLTGEEDEFGKSKYIRVPLPYGYNTLYAFGDTLASAVANGFSGKPFSPTSEAMNLSATVLNSFNPVGGSDTLLKQISPTLLDPLIEYGLNENFMGAPIRKENIGKANKPNSQLYFSSVSEPSRIITKKLNEITGGSDFRSGKIDYNPEAIDHTFGFFTGGAGSFLKTLVNTPLKLIDDKDLEENEIIFKRRFTGKNKPYVDRINYRSMESHVKAFSDEAKSLSGEEQKEFVKKYKTEIGKTILHYTFQNSHFFLMTNRFRIRNTTLIQRCVRNDDTTNRIDAMPL